jgi:hypothetical protein
MTMITGAAYIRNARILTLRSALRLEVLGMKHSRGSVYALVKREFGFKGNKRRVLDQLSTYVDTYILPPKAIAQELTTARQEYIGN